MEENQVQFLVSIVAPGDFVVRVNLLQHTHGNGVVRFSIALQQFDKKIRHSSANNKIALAPVKRSRRNVYFYFLTFDELGDSDLF
jgi:hypothetical protein